MNPWRAFKDEAGVEWTAIQSSQGGAGLSPARIDTALVRFTHPDGRVFRTKIGVDELTRMSVADLRTALARAVAAGELKEP